MKFPPALSLFMMVSGHALGAEPEPPRVNDPGVEVTLFATEPMIVHPTGVAVDSRGRVLVVETHTHFRTKEWKGPEHDQVVILTDTDNDGRADRKTVLFDQTDATMDIAVVSDGWVYLATRNEILRMRDDDGDGRAEKVERKVVWLETEGAHPHNGLSGLAPDGKGGLYFGMGENLGASYHLTGSDGTVVSDGGEDGNVWHCRLDGSGLRRVASGFWNPFGVCVDSRGNVFATDNDPSSRPPCRLHHVVEHGDYGFQYRYGRSGLHPFVSWNGDRPGTLPMMAGTGEAPCDVIWFAPEPAQAWSGLSPDWVGNLLVASWVDHRIEAYAPIPDGGSFRTEQRVLAEGGADFRPVAMAVADDGAMYVTDWVKRNYETHGFGRVWKLASREPRPFSGDAHGTPNSTPEREFIEEMRTGPAPSAADALNWLSATDPHVYHAAIQRLTLEPPLVKQLASTWLPDLRQRIGILLASRRGLKQEGITVDQMPVEFVPMIDRSLMDIEPALVIEALRWIADDRMKSFRSRVEALAGDEDSEPEVILAAITTLARLDGDGGIQEKEMVERVKLRILDKEMNEAQRRALIAQLPEWGGSLSLADTRVLLKRAKDGEREWMVHYLGLLDDPAKEKDLLAVAESSTERPEVRLAALSHLYPNLEDGRLLEAAIDSDNRLWVAAGLGAFAGIPLPGTVIERLGDLDGVEWKDEISRLKGDAFASHSRPPVDDAAAWKKYLRWMDSEPDRERGRLVFLSGSQGGCAACHRLDGLGHPIGPDLTPLRDRPDAVAVLQSILQPSANVAPRYECFSITTTDGKVQTLFRIGESDGKGTYLDLDGKTVTINIEEIANRVALPRSIMPEGIASRLTDRELRDLLFYLTGEKL